MLKLKTHSGFLKAQSHHKYRILMVLFVDRASYKSIELIIAYPFSWFTAYDYSFGIFKLFLLG
jgi:hypothetical protein